MEKPSVIPDNGTAHRPCPTKGNLMIHKWIRETENKFPGVIIDKYAVMPDHLHLIVTIKERHAGRSENIHNQKGNDT